MNTITHNSDCQTIKSTPGANSVQLAPTDTPLVSVIIPVYNSAKYIQKAIDSVLDQTYSNYEIIVVDDGSTDETRQKLQSYRDKIRYVFQENKGSATARNLGINLAKGDLVAFLDSDDFWLMPEKLEKQVACFQRNPDLGGINTGWKIVDGAGKHIKTVQPWHKAPKLDLETWLKKKCVRTSAMMFRKEWLEKVGGFDPELRQSHDVDLILRLSLAGCNTEWLKEETVCYRQHDDNTTKDSLKQAKYVQAVLDKFFARNDLPESIIQQERQIRYHTLVWIAWYQYNAGNLDDMAKFLQQSLDLSPYLRVENISHWLSSFKRFSLERGESFDINRITNSSNWDNIIHILLELPKNDLKIDFSQHKEVLKINQDLHLDESDNKTLISSKKKSESKQQINVNVFNKPKLAVISWDLAHNPAGRSFLLADMASLHYEVDLIGAVFSFYGDSVWPPLQDLNSNVNLKTFKVNDIEDFINGAIKLAQEEKYDLVYVSKPRFPSLFLGMLIKHYSQCPLTLDIDDHELSFFKNQSKASFEELQEYSDNAKFRELYSEIWTRFSEELISYADTITVSNPALQQKYGGLIVRHGRNEKLFDPQLYLRHKVRQEFGYEDRDRVILFLGTPRPHKGIFQIADALESINNPDLVLCIIGTIKDQRILNRFTKYQNARIDFHPDQPWQKLPELISLADLICILQDPASSISDYQIPAKLTDAISMNIPVIVTKVPPLLDLIASKSVISVDETVNNLIEAIKLFIENKEEFLNSYIDTRDTFLTEFSYQVNAIRIKQALEISQKKCKPIPNLFYETVKLIDNKINLKNKKISYFISSAEQSKKINDRSFSLKENPINILFFWKQNDSDIYGRRQDMVVKYLAKSNKINKIIHFDAPISVEKLHQLTQQDNNAKFSQNNLVFTNVLKRFLKLKDTPKIIKRTFVYSENGQEKFLNYDLPSQENYPDFVKQCIKEAGIDQHTIAWVCPTSFEFPLLHKELNFSFIVADIIDDQRKWDIHPNYLKKLEENYRQILSKADLVFTNCQPVKESFAELNSNISIITNGAEVFKNTEMWSKPEELENIQGPIIGYVGNLSDRIDFELIKYVASVNKAWNIVLIGSAHSKRETQISELLKYDNIYFLGVKPYDEALSFIKYFNVAIIPHLKNKLTENMNPLKLYVYFSVGVPIVSTEIANIEEFSDSINVASNHQDFVKYIQQAIDANTDYFNHEKRNLLLQKIDWSSRVENILTCLEHELVDNPFILEGNKFQLAEDTSDQVKKALGYNFEQNDQRQSKLSTPSEITIIDFSYDGICSLCGTIQTFTKKHHSFREGYECNNCQASLRYREQASAILKVFGNNKHNCFAEWCKDEEFKKLSIYEPGVARTFRKYLADLEGYTQSFYWSDIENGDYKNGFQSQNLESLTYPDANFDLVITSEIMQNVRLPWKAFKEIRRVLKPGGYHVFTIPVVYPLNKLTISRVDTSSDENHYLMEPKYHASPVPLSSIKQKYLVYTDFGKDIVKKLQKIGYQTLILNPKQVGDNNEISKLLIFVSQKHK